jgi:hypothetical protein
MVEREKRTYQKIASPAKDNLNPTKVEPQPQQSEVGVISGHSFDEHIRMLSGAQSAEQLTALTTQLQRTYGNAYVQKLFTTRSLQAKLKPQQAEEEEEEQLQTTAESESALAGTKSNDVRPQQAEEEEEEQLQGMRESTAAVVTPENVEARIKKALHSGQPLPHSLQANLEPRFGEKLNQVRIHADTEANRLARALDAAAFTSGRDIFFSKGAYNPDTVAGRRLIMRELSHVAEQEHRQRSSKASSGQGIHTTIPLSITPMTMMVQGKIGTSPIWQAEKVAPKPISDSTLLKAAPHVFVNGGKTGTAQVWWGGGAGGGGQGNQYVGSVTEVQPVIRTSRTGPLGLWGQPIAYIKTGTGTATVTRSYVGVLVGANGTYYITARAAAQIDRHEEDHVNSSRRHHDTYIVPLEARVAEHTGSNKALQAGDTPDAARAALETYIDWTTAINNFTTHDTTDNTPGGTVDQGDQADPNTKFDYGPRDVNGTHYDHYVDVPPGPPAETTAQTTGEGTGG